MEVQEADSWKLYKVKNFVKQHSREYFPMKMPPENEWMLENTKNGSLFGYVQFDIELPDNLQESFANFSLILKNNIFDHDTISALMKKSVE